MMKVYTLSFTFKAVVKERFKHTKVHFGVVALVRMGAPLPHYLDFFLLALNKELARVIHSNP